MPRREDTLLGGNGNDVLNGDAGTNTNNGGTGRNTCHQPHHRTRLQHGFREHRLYVLEFAGRHPHVKIGYSSDP
ncbi:hypothetical protein ACWGGS_01620 [Streptomyces decoyicus]